MAAIQQNAGVLYNSLTAGSKIVGTIVGKCVKENKSLDELTLDEYKEFSDIFDKDLYDEISLESCVAKRISKGSTGYASVKEQIEYVEAKLK